MAEEEEHLGTIVVEKGAPTIQILNMVPQKIIQVNKPAGYYKNREKTKIFIY